MILLKREILFKLAYSTSNVRKGSFRILSLISFFSILTCSFASYGAVTSTNEAVERSLGTAPTPAVVVNPLQQHSGMAPAPLATGPAPEERLDTAPPAVVVNPLQQHLAMTPVSLAMGAAPIVDSKTVVHRSVRSISLLEHELYVCIACHCGGPIMAINYCRSEIPGLRCAGVICCPCVAIWGGFISSTCGPIAVCLGPCTTQSKRAEIRDSVCCQPNATPIGDIMCCPCFVA